MAYLTLAEFTQYVASELASEQAFLQECLLAAEDSVNDYCARHFNPPGVAGWVSLPGVVGNYLSTPDAGALDITADLCIVARLAPADWTPPANQTIVGKWTTSGNQRAYTLRLVTTGVLRLLVSAEGSGNTAIDSTQPINAVDGTWKWVAVTFDADNGAGGNDTRFWTSDDGATWTQLGTTVTNAGVATIFNSSAGLTIGAVDAGGSVPFAGLTSHVSVRSGIGPNGDVGGAEVFKFDATTNLPSDAAASTVTASTGQTVTVNRTGSPATELRPPHVTRLYVPHGDVVYIHDLVDAAGITIADNGTAVSVSDVQFEPVATSWAGRAQPIHAIRRLHSSSWVDSGWQSTVSVTSSRWGWPAVPPQVKAATRILAKDLAHTRTVRFGVAGIPEVGGAFRVRENPQVVQLLAKLRHPMASDDSISVGVL